MGAGVSKREIEIGSYRESLHFSPTCAAQPKREMLGGLGVTWERHHAVITGGMGSLPVTEVTGKNCPCTESFEKHFILSTETSYC